MIRDANGNELIYWPISGLIEGADSEVLYFELDVPSTPSRLSATHDSRTNVWVKLLGGDADPPPDPPPHFGYLNISIDPYDLAGLDGVAEFNCIVEALTPITGLERVPLSIVVGTSSGAGWRFVDVPIPFTFGVPILLGP